MPNNHLVPKSIAVVGGGLSGLATAFYLKKYLPDASTCLIEASERVGGVIRTEVVETSDNGTFVLDHGADMFAVQPAAALELCRDLGVEDQLIVPDGNKAGAMVVHRGRLVPIPDGFVLMRATKPWQMVTTPLLSIGGKFRFLAERFVRQPAQDDVSVGEFVRHRMGQEVLDRLVGPLVAGIYTADVEKLSLEATMAPISKMVKEHGSLAQATLARRRDNQDATERESAGARYARFRGFPGGMQDLIDALSAAIGESSIRLQSSVGHLEPCEEPAGGWNVEVNGSSERYDAVVLATPAHLTAGLLASVKDPASARDNKEKESCTLAANELSSIEYASTAIVVMAVRKSQVDRLPNKFGFVVPPIENRKILAASFASHKYSIRCPEDHVIMRVFVGGATQSELLSRSDDELIDIVAEEMADLIGLRGEPTITRVVRWNNAMPQYHVGHLDRVQRIEDAIDAIDGLHLMTNALRGVGIAPVVEAARSVAKRISEIA